MKNLFIILVRLLLDGTDIRYRSRLLDAIEAQTYGKPGRPPKSATPATSGLPDSPPPAGEAPLPPASPALPLSEAGLSAVVEEVENPLEKYSWLRLSQENGAEQETL